MKMALGFKGGDLNLQTYRITTVSSQLVHNVLPHFKVNLFNNLEWQYLKETVIHYVMALGLFKPLPI